MESLYTGFAVGKYAIPLAAATALLVFESVDPTIVVTFIAAIQAAVIGWIRYRQKKTETRQDQAAAADEQYRWYMETLSKRLDDERNRTSHLEDTVDQLRLQMSNMHRRLSSLLVGADRLVNQIESTGAVPVWRPPQEEEV